MKKLFKKLKRAKNFIYDYMNNQDYLAANIRLLLFLELLPLLI